MCFFFKNPSGVEGVKARENELGNFLQIVAIFFFCFFCINFIVTFCHIYNGAFQRREQQQQAVWWKQFFAIFNLKNLQKSVKFSAYKNFQLTKIFIHGFFLFFGGGILSLSVQTWWFHYTICSLKICERCWCNCFLLLSHSWVVSEKSPDKSHKIPWIDGYAASPDPCFFLHISGFCCLLFKSLTWIS